MPTSPNQKNPGIKIPFLPAPQVHPTATRCVKVIIPDDDAYVLLLSNLLMVGSNWFSYQRDEARSGAATAQAMRIARQDPENFMNCFDCDDLSDCSEEIWAIVAGGILGNPIRQALDQYMQENGYLPGSPVAQPPTYDPIIGTKNLLPDGWICEPDNAFGMSRWIIEQINELVVQLVEEIDLATGPVDLINTIADNIEIVSYVATISEVLAWAQDQLAVYYNEAYNDVIRDELACQLMCVIQYGCSISLEQLQNFYAERLSGVFDAPPLTDDVNAFFEWLADLTFGDAGDIAVVSACHYVVASVLRYAGKAFHLAMGWRTWEQIIALGRDETSDEWEILCTEPCAQKIIMGINGLWIFPPDVIAEFGEFGAEYGYEIGNDYFACVDPYPPSVALYTLPTADAVVRLWTEFTFNAPVTINYVKAFFSQQRTSGTYNRQAVIAYAEGDIEIVRWERVKDSGGYDFSYAFQTNTTPPGNNQLGLVLLVKKIRIEHDMTEGNARIAIQCEVSYH
jgi:hypothetical protein